jgi:hypothetical protein
VSWQQWHLVYDDVKLARTVALLTSRSEFVSLQKVLDFKIKGMQVLR